MARAQGQAGAVATDIREGEVTATTERFYIDCEFDGHNGALLSIALVKDDGDGIHIKTTAPVADDWVFANVLPLMDSHNAPKSASVNLYDVGKTIRAFIGDCKCPVIVADSPVDIGRFCRALSTDSDGGWASADYPVMRFEVHNVDCYPTDLPGAVQHNAWWDAMALRHKLAALKAAELPDDVAGLVEKARRNVAEAPEVEICPVLVSDMADNITALSRQLAEREAEIVRLREEIEIAAWAETFAAWGAAGEDI